jgi:MFS family permease
MRRVTLREILALNAYWIGLSFMWNSLHVIILPAVLLHLVPESQKNTALGLLTMAGLVIAMIVQPISGATSDRWRSRWGRRRPLILLGTAFDFLFLAFLAWSGGLVWLALGYIGLQFSSNIAHGPTQGLLPDRVPPEQIGWASGFKNLMDMGGLVASSLLVGRLLGPEDRHPVGAVISIAIVLAAGAAVTLLGVRERPTAGEAKPGGRGAETSLGRRPVELGARLPVRFFKGLIPSWRDVKEHPGYWWLILSRFFFLAGIYGIQSFAQYYVRDVLAVPNPIQLTGDLLAVITLALMAFAVGGGWLGDRFGHKRILVVASLVAAAGCLLLLQARTPARLLAFGSIVGIGIGLFLTANWALANQQAPLAEAGKYLGLTNLATAGAGAFGRLQGPFIDFFNNARPGEWLGYTLLFSFAAVSILISAAVLKRVKSHPGEIGFQGSSQ